MVDHLDVVTLDDVRVMTGMDVMPVVVNDILNTALKRRASDIHFEPQLNEMGVCIRVDGVLHKLTNISNDLKGGVLSRLKIIGDMDIAEKRLPQDGRATLK